MLMIYLLWEMMNLPSKLLKHIFTPLSMLNIWDLPSISLALRLLCQIRESTSANKNLSWKSYLRQGYQDVSQLFFQSRKCRVTTLEYDVESSSSPSEDPLLKHPSSYQWLIRKLIFLTIIKPSICYVVHILNLFMHSPK